MNHVLSACLFAVCTACAAGMTSASAAGIDVACAGPAAGGQGVAAGEVGEPEDRQRLALLDALTSSPLQIHSLQKTIDSIPADQQADPLVARARLSLAALLLQANQVEAARAQLRRVALDSEAAIPAGLLMAETWAADGQAAALQWNLRLQQRWPAEPDVLAATLQRVESLPATEQPAAAASLARVRDDAITADRQLDALRQRLQQADWFARWLVSAGAPPLDAELLPVFYRTVSGAAFIAARNASLASLQPALCARARVSALEAMQGEIDHIERDARETLAILGPRQATSQASFVKSEQEYLAASRASPAQPADAEKGREVNRLRNAAARDAADIASLRSTLESLPAARTRLATQAQRLHAVSARINAQAGAEVRAALEAAITDRQSTLRDIAGSAAQLLGELQDPRYRKLRQ